MTAKDQLLDRIRKDLDTLGVPDGAEVVSMPRKAGYAWKLVRSDGADLHVRSAFTMTRMLQAAHWTVRQVSGFLEVSPIEAGDVLPPDAARGPGQYVLGICGHPVEFSQWRVGFVKCGQCAHNGNNDRRHNGPAEEAPRQDQSRRGRNTGGRGQG